MIEILFSKYPLLRVFYKGLVNRAFAFLDRENGVRVMEENWDNLIILDACRFDSFRKINWIGGRLKKKISLGSHTREWIQKNFQREYPDTVYVSGNPQISKIKLKKRFNKSPFFHIEEVWNYGWNEEEQVLPPEKVTDAAIDMRKKYPNKKLLIHYMQPHWPFLLSPKLSRKGLSSIELSPPSKGLLWKIMQFLSQRYEGANLALKKRARKTGNVWDYMRVGKVRAKEAKKAYEDNLILVLKEAERLVGELRGKSIITSDHGNLFGEHYIFGHPPGLRFKELIEVPWLEIE